MLTVETVVDDAELFRLVPEWTALEATITPRMPFRTPWWNLLWWHHLGKSHALVRDEMRVYAVRNAQRELLAIAPMMITRRPGALMRLVRELRFFGADVNITEQRGLVCRAEHQPGVIAALREAFNDSRADWDVIHWAGIDDSPAAREAIEQTGTVRWGPPIEDFFLPMPRQWDDFRAALPRNTKEALRKCYNSLKRDGHEFRLRVASRPDQTPAALDRFLELHAERALREDTVTHPNVFAEPAARAFLLDFCQHLAQRDQLRVFQLEIGGEIVATRVAFQMGNELFLYYSGYLPDWGRYSVMTTVVAEALRWSIERGVRRVNLSTGSDPSKLRWRPDSRRCLQALQASETWHSRLRFGVYRWLRDLNLPVSPTPLDRPTGPAVLQRVAGPYNEAASREP